MLYNVKGKLTVSDVNFIVVECGGVGFKCSLPSSYLALQSTRAMLLMVIGAVAFLLAVAK